jgi:hypothetical protein
MPTWRSLSISLLLLCTPLMACTEPEPPPPEDGGVTEDAGPGDSGSDAGMDDAGTDPGDAGADGGTDAGCSSRKAAHSSSSPVGPVAPASTSSRTCPTPATT